MSLADSQPEHRVWLRRIAPLAIAVIVTISYLPMLGATFELSDDHTILRWANDAPIHPQIPDEPMGASRFLNDSLGRGRCLISCHTLWYAQVAVFGDHVLAYRVFWLVTTVATSLLLYLTSLKFLQTIVPSVLFSLSVMLCPASNDVWPHLIRGESLGLTLCAVTLYSLVSWSQRRSAWLGVVAYAMLCLTKENFFLLSPALAVLSWRREPTRMGLSSGYLVIGIVTGGFILWNVLTAGATSHGGRSLNSSVTALLFSVFRRDGILESLLLNGLAMLPGVLVGGFCLLKRKEQPNILWGAAIGCLWVVPQVVIYSTRHDFSPRYAFPALLCPLFFNAWGIHQLAKMRMRAGWCLGVTVTVVWLIRSAQVQFTETLNIASETQAISAVVRAAAEKHHSGDRLLIVAPPKTELAMMILSSLARQGIKDRVDLWQPSGSDGDYFGFYGCIIEGPVDPQNYSGIIVMSPDLVADMVLGQTTHFTYNRVFVSLRQMRLTHSPHALLFVNGRVEQDQLSPNR